MSGWMQDAQHVDKIRAAVSDDDCVALVRDLQRKLRGSLSSTETFPAAQQWIEFLKYAFDIKETERTGWRLRGIQGGETVACHMYRMALMASLLTPPKLDKTRCIEMALVHDLAEAIVGDITPDCGVSREEKHHREEQAMSRIVGCLEASPQARRVQELWNEYEEDGTEEADFVHQLDKLELALQASEYEQKHGTKNLRIFTNSANPRITDPRLRLIMDRLLDSRPS